VSVLEFRHVSKKFKLRRDRVGSLRATVIDRLRGASHRGELWVLRDVCFEIDAGETVAIVGANGSGKSTILKLVAGIIEPTRGVVKTRGSVASLLELGTGFHADYTGRENIYLFGSFQGQSPKEVDKRYDEIVAFSELKQFIDQPVKHYSSGMYLRLAFSAAIILDPDILLIDEMLAVGDEHFQRKCLDRLAELRALDKTIVIVTHDLRRVRQVCTRALWIENGVCLQDGLPDDVVDSYLRRVGEQEGRTADVEALVGRASMPLDVSGPVTH
jgi:ABC-type polysaccharide/polyol phosphate transport system ATPase subunit